MHRRGPDAVSVGEDARGGRAASKPQNRGTRGNLQDTMDADRSKMVWPGLRRWDIFEGPTRVLPEVPLIGEVDLKNMVPHALKADRHLGQFEVHLVYDGIREVWLDRPENAFIIPCGSGIVIQAGQLHGGVRNAQYPARYIAIRFRFPRSNTAALPGISSRQTFGIRQTLERLKHPAFTYSRKLGDILLQLLAEHRQRGVGMEVAARGHFLEFLAWLQRDLLRAPASADASGTAVSPEIRKGLAYMEQNIGISFSIENMAEAAGLSPSRFRRLFHKQTGLSPHDYRARRRVELSQHLLRTGKQSVTEVAMDLGFASAAHFALVFRRFVGVAPSQWRNQGNAGNE